MADELRFQFRVNAATCVAVFPVQDQLFGVRSAHRHQRSAASYLHQVLRSYVGRHG